MQSYSKTFTEDEDGFEGNIEAYSVSTEKENLLNWLKKEADEPEKVYEAIKSLLPEILIIKNLNVDEKFQGNGYGSEIITNVLNESFAQGAILLCDIAEPQNPGFFLEKFYEMHDFKAIQHNLDYPIMVFPSSLADKIIEKLSNQKTSSIKP